MKTYEEMLFKLGYKKILGVDEAGRGSMAGPLVVAGVILDFENIPLGINDSKKLTQKMREKLFTLISESAKFIGVSFISESIIDKINIYKATIKGMKEVINFSNCDAALIDAVKFETKVYSKAIIKGDQKSVSIAAASIVAKVMRDRYMENLSTKVKNFSFDCHKGYVTKKHLKELSLNKVTVHHRTSYLPVKKALDLQENKKLV